jgi:hypothetical protein
LVAGNSLSSTSLPLSDLTKYPLSTILVERTEADFGECTDEGTAFLLSCLGFIGCGPFGVVAFIVVAALSLKLGDISTGT